jgi:hypothetical protein
MNKVIFTDSRLFMAVVGPSASGKTRLILQMLLESAFHPNFRKIYFFYQEYQDIYEQIRRMQIDIHFMPCVDFEMIKDLSDCLLIFDDSCEEIYSDKHFVKLATSGRHRNVHVIYVKHNLFFQSKFSRTIDLNNTHMLLFKSPRDVNQIRYLGKQLNNSQFLADAYQKATIAPYGHLLIDLDPKTSDCLRYCSNIVGPEPSIFYLPSSKAIITPITNDREIRGYAENYYRAIPQSTKIVPAR